MNDLIGLEYQWGASFTDGKGCTDCFQLVCEIRKRLGLSDYSSKFEWAYDSYTQETFKPIRLAKWLLQTGRRLTLPEHGAVALLANPTSPALGSVVNGSVVFISAGKRVIRVPTSRVSAYYFWID
tara:strand:+ start:884 stop:1258 length:375 start_codon:yes stop_codon:yes gene_type:complete